MTETSLTLSEAEQIARLRKSKWVGAAFVLAAIAVAFFFGYGTVGKGDAVLRLSRHNDLIILPDLVIPSTGFAYFVAIVLTYFGVRSLIMGRKQLPSLMVYAFCTLLTIMALLSWAVAGKSMLLTGMLNAALVNSVPIALGGIAGVLSERVAVMNIAIEGMLLAGAFAGAVAGALLGGPIGLLAATLVGGVFGCLLAALVVTYRVDQIIAGVVINLFVLGVTSFVSSQVLSEYRSFNSAPIFRAINIPLLSDIPVIGPVFFKQNLFVYGAALIALISTYYLFHTRSGLRARAVGEYPRAADTVGLDVYKIRYFNVTIAGMVAGFGGAWFTLGSVGRFSEGMTGGLGFIGLAAMIFGRWHPLGVCLAALVFGFASALQQKLAILKTPIPSEFLAMVPYFITIILVAGVVGRSRPPAAIGQEYVKE